MEDAVDGRGTKGLHVRLRNLLRRNNSGLFAAFFLLLCLGPYATRLRSPSLYADDIVRVSELQNSPPYSTLFRPFNEHMAPLFEVVSWLTWRAAGESLARSSLAFTLVSFIPFLLTLGLIERVIRTETGSASAALGSVAIFSLSWLAIETVYWYSASSFMWALAATLVAWIFARKIELGLGFSSGLFTAIATAAAPAFSGIGLLAGPLAWVRIVGGASVSRDKLTKRLARGIIPLAGTASYLVICSFFRYRAVLASNLGQRADLIRGLKTTLIAPVWTLLPSLAGIRLDVPSEIASILAIAATLLCATILTFRFRRGSDRPLVLGGLLLIGAGYAMAFCARAGDPGQPLLETQRYHLFPMLGLLFVLAPAIKAIAGRWDSEPSLAIRVATLFAAVLLLSHSNEMRGRALFMRSPDQVRTLTAIDHLGQICVTNGATRSQALATLDPIETAWTPAGINILTMLPPGAPISTLGDDRVKTTLLSALSAPERASICGGMDVSRYLVADSDAGSRTESAQRPVKRYRVGELSPGRYQPQGWPSFLEYGAATAEDARGVSLSGFRKGDLVELWWRGEDERWSETRSVRFRAPGEDAWILPLERVPHWQGSKAKFFRLLFHESGPIATDGPRLIR